MFPTNLPPAVRELLYVKVRDQLFLELKHIRGCEAHTDSDKELKRDEIRKRQLRYAELRKHT